VVKRLITGKHKLVLEALFSLGVKRLTIAEFLGVSEATVNSVVARELGGARAFPDRPKYSGNGRTYQNLIKKLSEIRLIPSRLRDEFLCFLEMAICSVLREERILLACEGMERLSWRMVWRYTPRSPVEALMAGILGYRLPDAGVYHGSLWGEYLDSLADIPVEDIPRSERDLIDAIALLSSRQEWATNLVPVWDDKIHGPILEEWLGRISPMDRNVVELYFGFEARPMTLEEIGRKLGITRERIREIRDRGMKNLRDSFEVLPGEFKALASQGSMFV